MGQYSEEEQEYLAILTNVDSSATKVDIGGGLRIEGIPTELMLQCLGLMEGIPVGEVQRLLFGTQAEAIVNSDEKKVFIVRASFSGETHVNAVIGGVEKKIHIDDYLRDHVLRSYRLFQGGSVFMPIRYDGIFKRHFYYIRTEPKFHLEDDEIHSLEDFLKKSEFPFKFPYLNTALDFYEQSYETERNHVCFTLLTVCMETLLLAEDELGKTRKISSRFSRLLYDDPREQTKYQEKMRNLYEKRCEIVHEGKQNAVTLDDVVALRRCVGRSILKAAEEGLEKDALIKRFNP